MPDDNTSASLDVKDIMREAMKRAQPELAREWNGFVDRGVALFDKKAQDIIGKISGGNPFIASALNTTLNYSKQQATSFLVQQLNKFNKFI